MTRLHARSVGDQALLSRTEFEQLVELARRGGEIELDVHEDDVPAFGIMRLGEQGGGVRLAGRGG